MPTPRVRQRAVSSARRSRPATPSTNGQVTAKGNGTAGLHTETEDHPWTIEIPDHPKRTDSPEYVASRSEMNNLGKTVADFYYGASPWQDHHGGGLWLKDAEGWFMVRNLAGMEWSSQFCADPQKVDMLRLNARRLYALCPEAVQQLGIQSLLDTPITDTAGVARWTDSICNASVPLPAGLHTGVLPQGGGVHHYPAPIVEIALFKYDSFKLWVTDPQGQPAAVTPTSPPGLNDSRVQVVYSTPNTQLRQLHQQAEAAGEQLILPPDHPMARQAYRKQQALTPKNGGSRPQGVDGGGGERPLPAPLPVPEPVSQSVS